MRGSLPKARNGAGALVRSRIVRLKTPVEMRVPGDPDLVGWHVGSIAVIPAPTSDLGEIVVSTVAPLLPDPARPGDEALSKPQDEHVHFRAPTKILMDAYPAVARVENWAPLPPLLRLVDHLGREVERVRQEDALGTGDRLRYLTAALNELTAAVGAFRTCLTPKIGVGGIPLAGGAGLRINHRLEAQGPEPTGPLLDESVTCVLDVIETVRVGRRR